MGYNFGKKNYACRMRDRLRWGMLCCSTVAALFQGETVNLRLRLLRFSSQPRGLVRGIGSAAACFDAVRHS